MVLPQLQEYLLADHGGLQMLAVVAMAHTMRGPVPPRLSGQCEGCKPRQGAAVFAGLLHSPESVLGLVSICSLFRYKRSSVRLRCYLGSYASGHAEDVLLLIVHCTVTQNLGRPTT